MTESVFGPLVDPWDVQEAVLATYREWLPTYLAEVERQKELDNLALGRPPSPDSYYGGVDFDSWSESETPAVIVTCVPEGAPEHGPEVDTQGYQVQVGCVVVDVDEDRARMVASHFGAASMLLVQQSGLGGLAERIVMSSAPRVEFPNPEDRRVARSVAAFAVWVTPIVNTDAGPTVVPTEPEEPAAEWPTATDVDVTIEAAQIDP